MTMSILGNEMPRAWVPGDDITTHPLWGEQVQLEREMMRKGADAVRNRVIKATEKERLGTLSPVRKLSTDWVPKVADALKAWLSSVEKSRGPTPIAYPFIKEMDKHVAALIGCRVILNYIGSGKANLQSVCMEIGRTVEHEQQVRLWESKAPEAFYSLQKDQEFRGTTSGHRALVNINVFNSLLKDPNSVFSENNVSWSKWSREAIFRVGWAIMEAIVTATGWFDVAPGHTDDPRPGKTPLLEVRFKAGLQEWFRQQVDHLEANSPQHWPTVVPPKRWQGTRDGGYYTPYARPPRLIRFKASQEHQRERAADEYEALDMPTVYSAINVLQETPWKVNQPVLEAANALWYGEKYAFKSMPEQTERELPPRTPRMVEQREREDAARKAKLPLPKPDEKTREEIDDWKREASQVYAFNNQAVGRTRATDGVLELANDFAHREHFFFPHMLDFRGRCYPIPSRLQPQGDDLPRGLLTFGTSVPVSSANDGDEWLAIHTANVWGQDKKPMAERIQWTRANSDMLCTVAGDALGINDSAGRDWLKESTDKPFQALAAAIEWTSFLQQGDGFMSSLPCMVDGTCNGLQHLSALSRDEDAGWMVNLTPAETQQDIYKFVAEDLQAILEDAVRMGGQAGDVARWWLDLCGWNLPRSLTKRQVMVLPYGGTKEAFFGYVREWLQTYAPMTLFERGPTAKEDLKARVVYMASRMWEVVNRRLRKALGVMKWLQDCAKQAALMDQPIYWVTPSGMVVRHFYGVSRDQRVKSYLDGTEVKLTFRERTNKLSVKEQLQGISPNYIHSLDASCLHLTTEACQREGIGSFASVHDAYGTHAGNMTPMSRILRQSFVDVHSHDLLGAFRESCIDVMEAVYVDTRRIDPMEARCLASDELDKTAGRIELGSLEIQEVINSPYFFA
jgi:DNA-directed RNA polymerase